MTKRYISDSGLVGKLETHHLKTNSITELVLKQLCTYYQEYEREFGENTYLSKIKRKKKL